MNKRILVGIASLCLGGIGMVMYKHEGQPHSGKGPGSIQEETIVRVAPQGHMASGRAPAGPAAKSDMKSEKEQDVRGEWLRKTLRENPQAAVEWVSAQSGREQMMAGMALAQAWADVDPTAALKWAAGLHEPGLREGLKQNVCRQIAMKSPEAALKAVDELGPGLEMPLMKGDIIMRWAHTAPDAALQYAQSEPDPATAELLLSRTIIAMAADNPVRAANLAVEKLKGTGAFEATTTSVVQKWVESVPAEAAAWVADFAESPLKTACAKNVTGTWAATDMKGAEQWLNSLPAGPARTESLELLEVIKHPPPAPPLPQPGAEPPGPVDR